MGIGLCRASNHPSKSLSTSNAPQGNESVASTREAVQSSMITIHCGLHKTGTSSIQFALANTPKHQLGFLSVPSPGMDRSDSGWRSRLAQAFDSPYAVLSDEALLGSPFDGYSAAESRADMVAKALAGRPAQIVVYLRPQHSWLLSVFIQAAQQGEPLDASNFVQTACDSPWIKWSHLIAMLTERTGVRSVVPRVYAPGRDVVSDFFYVSGLGPTPNFGKPGVRENVSVSPAHVPILRAILQSGEFSEGGRSAIRQSFQGVLSQGAPKGIASFSRAEQERVTEVFRDDWILLANQLSDTYPDEAESMLAVVREWPSNSLPSLDGGLENPIVIQEMARCLGILASSQVTSPDGFWTRGWRKITTDPASVPGAFVRAWRKHLGR